MMKFFKKNIKKIIYFFSALRNFLKFVFFDIKKIKRADIVFFFPCYQTGGAEKVHLNIVKAVRHKSSCVIFTENSATTNFLPSFKNESSVVFANNILNKKNEFINKVFKIVLLKTINRSKIIKTVFSSNTQFYYDILPFINSRITRIDLMHDFYLPRPGNKDFNVHCVDYLDYRVVISENAKDKLMKHYQKNNVNSIYSNRIVKIENGVEMDHCSYLSKLDGAITIGYIGRWSEEKRNDIFIQIAKTINDKYENVKFIMAGIGMKSNLKKINEAGVSFLGEITDEKLLMQIYKSLDFLLITSIREGFPMVIMESMAQGVIPVTTNVGGIKEHIIDDYNGILIENNNDEKTIINDFLISIESLLEDKEKRDILSKNAFVYSRSNFKIEDFNKRYLNIFFK